MVIVFTGGGTAGHISLNLALIPHFLKKGYTVHYIGSKTGMERELIGDIKEVKYHAISTGKLRRYFNINNFIDPFKILNGIITSKKLLKQIKPDIVFSKGGFVSVPVVVAAHSLKIPTILHESDITPGLANRLAVRYSDQIFTTFESKNESLKGKDKYVGAIVREDLKTGSKKAGLEFTKLNGKKPVLLITGGSSGARSINDAVRKNLDELLKNYDVIHICGKGNKEEIKKDGYVQFEFVKAELKDIFACSDIVVSRAGANFIFELLSIRKPMLLIPLGTNQSRGDQVLNAEYFKEKGYCNVLADDKLDTEFVGMVKKTYIDSGKLYKNMLGEKEISSIGTIVEIIDKKAKRD